MRRLFIILLALWVWTATVPASYIPAQPISIAFSAGDSGGLNPADATAYYFGMQSNTDPTTSTDGGYAVMAPRTGVIVAAYGDFLVAGTLASAGSTTVAVRNVTANTLDTITSSAVMTSAVNRYSSTSLNIAITGGDQLLIKFTGPTWATNPTQVFPFVTLVIR